MSEIDKGQHRDAKYQISKLLSVSEKNSEVGFLSSYDPNCDPRGGASFDPTSII